MDGSLRDKDDFKSPKKMNSSGVTAATVLASHQAKLTGVNGILLSCDFIFFNAVNSMH